MQLRAQLLERVNAVLAVRDTPRGLIVAVTESSFNPTALRGGATNDMARLAAILISQPSLKVAVEGHTDSAVGEPRDAEVLSLAGADASFDDLSSCTAHHSGECVWREDS